MLSRTQTKIIAFAYCDDIVMNLIVLMCVDKWNKTYGDDIETLKHQTEMEVLNDKIV